MTKLLSNNIVDLKNNQTTVNAINNFEELLEKKHISGNELSIILGDLIFTGAHISKLEAIAKNYNKKIALVYTKNSHTQLSALNIGLMVSEKSPSEVFLDDFKDSLSLEINENLNQQGNNENQEEKINNKEEPQNKTELNNENNEQKNETPSKETTINIINSNDVVEVLNTEEKIEQEKVELPFEVESQLIESSNAKADSKTLLVNQTLRSGQIIAFEGNVVIAGDTHPGSEIIATGDIIVWGTLSGIAHAGAGNNYKATIRSLKMNPIQLRIADIIARRPDVERGLNKYYPIKPEVARVSNEEIKIFSLK